MSFLDEELPDMAALHQTNDLIPDPSKLKTTVIPAEDIAGWFLPFEIVFGIVYYEQLGIYLLLALLVTVIFGWIVPMQQRYAMLAKSEFMKEKTMLGHLTWDEQCELIQFEPILEPAYKIDEEGRPILDSDHDPLPDELDLEDWISQLDLEGRIIDHDDGLLSQIHTLDNRYIANLFQQMYEMRNQQEEQDPTFSHDKKRWLAHSLSNAASKLASGLSRGLRWSGGKAKGAGGTMRNRAPSAGRATKSGSRRISGWFSANKMTFAGAVILGFMLILFSNWIWWGLEIVLQIFGWTI